jgi:hypothetical protein
MTEDMGMSRVRTLLLEAALLFPAALLASTDTAFNSPANGSTVIVTPNQSLPVQATIRNTTTGLGALIPVYYTAQTTVTPACPPAANPCANYLVPTGLPTFVLYGGHAFAGAITTINFQNAPAGFYSVTVATSIQGCAGGITCQVPDTSGGSIQFTVQVISAVGTPSNVLPHFAAGGSFVTDLLVVNSSAQAAQFSISFYTDSGAPATLPFNGLGSLSTLTDTIPGFGTGFYEAGNPQSPLQGGWAMVKADPSITVQVLFRNHASNGSYYEAAVPSYPGSGGFRVSFDATTFPATGDPLYTGIAIVNLDAQNSAVITCVARDFRGVVIPNAINVPVLSPLGHWANYLFPALVGARGTIECSSSNSIAGIGLRFIGTNAFSSLPVITQ